MNQSDMFDVQTILDSLNDGVYVTDTDRTIVYWSKSAERITGWNTEDIQGRHCRDNLLNHVDKDNHPLCGKEYCPLHRSIVTGESSTAPILVYAKAKDGRRIPMQVSVAPIRDRAGEIIGGVETFRDYTKWIDDIERAKKIQSLSLSKKMADDPRVRFSTHYVPHDIIGGDFYAIEKTDENHYAFFLADVTGHGISAALYTMHLKSLWEEYRDLRANPRQFLETINRQLWALLSDHTSFAAGIYGLADVETQTVQLINAGNPYPYHVHEDGQFEQIRCSGLPLGLVNDASYETFTIAMAPGDHLFLFTDGAVEIFNSDHVILGEEGLLDILKQTGYPSAKISWKEVEDELLRYSNSIRLADDLTILDMHLLRE
ncbi:MAG: PAS domain S-box protein [Candidatus Omnitrophota bacterium]|jgi:PAS domain S-box-containing protein|nr:MAG: PAS domain S-box protein [Candidatus Omnitrophota bacterium]